MRPADGQRQFGLICTHVADAGEPVLYVARDEPQSKQDTGWSLSCGRPGHTDEDWLVVLLARYFAADPSLADVAQMPVGHNAERVATGQPWRVGPTADDE